MVVLLHIVTALASLALTSYTYFAPTQSRLRVASTLALATIASGTYLIWSNPIHMLQTCTTGLIYLALVATGIMMTRHKLAAVKA